jgi:hypothetical protein
MNKEASKLLGCRMLQEMKTEIYIYIYDMTQCTLLDVK